MEKQRGPIAVFDSGFGGLTILKEIVKAKKIKFGQRNSPSKRLIFNNYLHLCHELGIQPVSTGSNSYKCQLKTLDRCCYWYRGCGNAIYIDELYPELQPKIDYRHKEWR